MSSRKRRLTTLGAMAFGGYLLAGTLGAAPVASEPVSDEVASGLRGGVCQWLKYSHCPGSFWGIWCPYGTNVVSGNVYGKATGDIACNSSCGSFFANIVYCSGTTIVVTADK